MASVYVVTTRQMDEPVKEAFYEALCDALSPTFSLYSLILNTLPAEASGQLNRDKTAAFICVPPNIDTERCRTVVKALNDAVTQVFCPGHPEDSGLMVAFPYHTSDCVGKHGVLRSDAENK